MSPKVIASAGQTCWQAVVNLAVLDRTLPSFEACDAQLR